jgi:hypothetical protein
MTRKSIVCIHCGGQNFEIDYGTDCSADKKGRQNWRLDLACTTCGYLTPLADTAGYIPEVIPINVEVNPFEKGRKAENHL